MEVFKKYIEEQKYREMIMNEQNELRERLIKARRANPKPWMAVANEIGINVLSLKQFRLNTVETSYLVLCKIEDWIKKQEQLYP
jgi:hypothetical protein